MKRVFSVVVCLVLTLLASTAVAAVNGCSCCYYDGTVFWCDNFVWKHKQTYIFCDEAEHLYQEWDGRYCPSCNGNIGKKNFISTEYFESHTYSGNVCTKCGYNRITGEIESVAKDYSYEHSLQEEAYQMKDKLIGSIATVVNDGNIRRRPDKESDRLGKAKVGDTYTILDYYIAPSSHTAIWLKVKYGHTDGWLSASLVQISENDGGSSGGIVGSQVSITLSSANARSGAGKSYPKTGSVRQGEVFTVLDSKAASDGTLWYKIEKYGQYHWISSGITEKAW